MVEINVALKIDAILFNLPDFSFPLNVKCCSTFKEILRLFLSVYVTRLGDEEGRFDKFQAKAYIDK